MSLDSDTKSMSRLSTGKVALLMVLLSESVFFATLLVAYAALRGEANWQLPRGLPNLTFPLLNTCVLLLSLWPARRAQLQARTGRASGLLASQGETLALGMLFIAGQIFEYSRAGLRIDDPGFGAVFFALMGFHALHLLAGVVFLALNLIRAHPTGTATDDTAAVEIGTLFWYYVVAVWVVLFTALYLV